MGSPQNWAWSPTSGGLGIALQLCGGNRVDGDSKDSLKGCEGMVFSHCHCDGLGTLVMEEVGCQAGKRGTAASEQESAVMSLVFAPQGIYSLASSPRTPSNLLGWPSYAYRALARARLMPWTVCNKF